MNSMMGRRKQTFIIALIISVLCLAGTDIFCALPVHAETKTDTASFCDDWLFLKEDDASFSDPAYDDAQWQRVDIPHDWSITEAFTEEGEAESGFLPGGTGWYRKHITFDQEDAGKTVIAEFDGIYMNSTVWFNGVCLGTHPYGYTSASFDLSPYVRFGEDNVLSVRVENTQPNSRWYSGSGMIRPAHLHVLSQTYILPHSVYAEAQDLAKKYTSSVSVHVNADIRSTAESSVQLSVKLLDKDGTSLGQADKNIKVKAGTAETVQQTLSVSSPHLWSPADPYLYTLVYEVRQDGVLLDRKETAYGFRWFAFDADTGFSLNGEPLKLQGVCLHHDQGALGAVSDPAAIGRQLDILKDMGVNAIRSTHNPASEELLRLCDEKGFLLIDEAFDTWYNSKNHNLNDYGAYFGGTIAADNALLYGQEGMSWAEYDVKDMVRRGRSHACVIMWSLGNEILGNIGGDTSGYPQAAEDLCKWVRELDEERPVTIGDNMINTNNPIAEAVNEVLVKYNGVIGFNYALPETYDARHEQYPDRALYGSETASAYGSRGVYSTFGINRETYQITAYDIAHVEWGTTAQDAWLAVISRDFIAGEFIWTGFDYIGEPEPWNGMTPGSVTGAGPVPRSSYFGVIDTAGFPKDSYYYYRSQWNHNDTTLHILPVWDPEQISYSADGTVPVVVYSNAPSVELFLNDVSLGRKNAETVETEAGFAYQLYEGETALQWSVPYSEGTLRAAAYDSEGNLIESTVGRAQVSTPAAAYTTAAEADRTVLRADGRDLCYVSVILQDEAGNEVTGDERQIRCVLEGPGVIAGSDNGSPADLSSFRGVSDTEAYRDTFSGKALFIIRAGREAGEIRITVSSEGLQSQTILVTTETVETKEEEAPEVVPEAPEEEIDMLEYLRNNWLVLLLYAVFIVLLIGFIRVQIKNYKRGDFKKKKKW